MNEPLSPALSPSDGEREKLQQSSRRPTAVATTRKRSFTPLVTVETTHNPSLVASPSSRWKTQRNPAPFGVAATASHPRSIACPPPRRFDPWESARIWRLKLRLGFVAQTPPE